ADALAVIAKLRRENPAAYFNDAALLRRERELIAKRDALPEAEADEWRRTPEDARARFDSALVAEWESRGGFAVNLSRAQDAVAASTASRRATRPLSGHGFAPSLRALASVCSGRWAVGTR